MSARAWTFTLAGLGALSLSCAGLQQVAAATGNGELVAAVKRTSAEGKELASAAGRVLWNSNDCDKLRARVSFEEERALGGAVALNWVKGGKGLLPPIPAPGARASERSLQEYVNTVGRNLAAQSPRPTLPWTFGVLKSATAYNAASAPGGYVFVSRGLLKDMENEAQLAGVLAHEIAHVTLHHALDRYDDVKVKQCKVLAAREAAQEVVGDFSPAWVAPFRAALDGSGLDLDHNVDLLGSLTNQVVEKLVTDGFAEEDEYAADEVAVRLLLSAGYEPEEYIRFLGKLRGGGSGYAHHPSTTDRQRKLRRLLNRAKEATGEFPELPLAEGLQKPALPPEFIAAQRGQ